MDFAEIARDLTVAVLGNCSDIAISEETGKEIGKMYSAIYSAVESIAGYPDAELLEEINS